MLQASLVRDSHSDYEAATLAHGDAVQTFAQGFAEDDNIDAVRFHVFKASAAGKPAADITVGHRYGTGGCENRSVAAQALASE